MLADYLSGPLIAPKNPNLVMTILVRDEADIITDNILFHSKQGVDSFVIGDNASTDGTREKVEKLAKDLPIHIVDFPDGEYWQTKWRTHMTRIAHQRFNAWWVINNDADEFWLAKSGNLKKDLLRKKAIMRAERFNMLSMTSDNPYYTSSWRVVAPMHYRSKHQKMGVKMSLALAKLAPKVAVNPRGLLFVRGGNHRAFHLYSIGIPPVLKNIRVYHFPHRGYKEFLASVLHRKETLEKHPSTRLGAHDYRWIKMADEGKLKDEYDNVVFDEPEALLLERMGIVVHDTALLERFAEIGLAKEKKSVAG